MFHIKPVTQMPSIDAIWRMEYDYWYFNQCLLAYYSNLPMMFGCGVNYVGDVVFAHTPQELFRIEVDKGYYYKKYAT